VVITAMASNHLLGHHLAEHFRGLPVNRQFRLQLGDPPPRRDQLGLITAGDSRYLTTVD